MSVNAGYYWGAGVESSLGKMKRQRLPSVNTQYSDLTSRVLDSSISNAVYFFFPAVFQSVKKGEAVVHLNQCPARVKMRKNPSGFDLI